MADLILGLGGMAVDKDSYTEKYAIVMVLQEARFEGMGMIYRVGDPNDTAGLVP